MKSIIPIDKIERLSTEEREKIKKVAKKFSFRLTPYYESLINWDDPHDPLRIIVIPNVAELNGSGEIDASHEADYTVVPGLEHKYKETALLLVARSCAAYCRFCFRKRLFVPDNNEVPHDHTLAFNYLQEHSEIEDVVLSGGDPLLLSTPKLDEILAKLSQIEHIKRIRIGTKIPAFNPFRILEDESLADMLSSYNQGNKRIYLMVHYNHPREITEASERAIKVMQEKNISIFHQTPLIKGVNNDPKILSQLFTKLSLLGIIPYYIFICRPTLGNNAYSIPVEDALTMFQDAQVYCSGLARTPRLIMSHSSGKIEILGMDDEHIYMKYHRAAEIENENRIMQFKRNRSALWFDDYKTFTSYTT